MRLFRKYKNCSDEELMSFIQANDYGAFEELHSRYAKRLLHFMFKMLNNDEERAQDLLQDLFLKLVEAPEKFDATRRFYSWVFTVAANMCRKEYRAPIHDDVSDVELEARMRNLATDRLISAVDGHVVKKHLSKALDGLDNKHRECFVLRHQEGFGVNEIAEILDLSSGTVKSRLHYGIKKLAVELEEFKPLLKDM